MQGLEGREEQSTKRLNCWRGYLRNVFDPDMVDRRATSEVDSHRGLPVGVPTLAGLRTEFD